MVMHVRSPALRFNDSRRVRKGVPMKLRAALFALVFFLPSIGQAETPEEWITLGTRIHGGFGVLIPIGIRIGLDAQERLKGEPRGLAVTYYMGEKAPCPCIADGVMLATQASPGQGTLQIAAEKAPAGSYAVVVIRNRKSGEAVKYSVSDKWIPKIIEWNRSLDPAGRYQAAMSAEGLFEAVPAQ
jgi:formylmethanofuran dehydrogenase subunit E